MPRASETTRAPRGGPGLGLAVLAVVVVLNGCSTEQSIPPAITVNIFISPSGEPFRGRANDPYPEDVWFARVDANHDGALSQDEFVNDAIQFFHKLDLNGDGFIDGAELSAYEQRVAPEILPRVIGLTARDLPPLPATDAIERDDQARQQAIQAERDAKEDAAPRLPWRHARPGWPVASPGRPARWHRSRAGEAGHARSGR